MHLLALAGHFVSCSMLLRGDTAGIDGLVRLPSMPSVDPPTKLTVEPATSLAMPALIVSRPGFMGSSPRVFDCCSVFSFGGTATWLIGAGRPQEASSHALGSTNAPADSGSIAGVADVGPAPQEQILVQWPRAS